MTNFTNQQKSIFLPMMREITFGMEDGMVSTLGAVVGIAIGSASQTTVVLAGAIIIAVESISMGIGSYIANSSQENITKAKIKEEKSQLKTQPQREKRELLNFFVADGWPKTLAQKMTKAAVRNKNLMFKEMGYRELRLPNQTKNLPVKNAFGMFLSYIFGGSIPLVAYFFLPINLAIPISIVVTLIGLFALGIYTSLFTKDNWFKAGLRILLLGGVALLVGLGIGNLFKNP